jgi:hypothetical protein
VKIAVKNILVHTVRADSVALNVPVGDGEFKSLPFLHVVSKQHLDTLLDRVSF